MLNCIQKNYFGFYKIYRKCSKLQTVKELIEIQKFYELPSSLKCTYFIQIQINYFHPTKLSQTAMSLLEAIDSLSSNSYPEFQESFLNASESKKESSQGKLNNLQLKSPTVQINRTAQQHFNNRTHHAFSGDNITAEQHDTSKSPNRRERSLISPGIERQFTDLDEFLKQTYEKHGITDLIRSFVDMEDQLISTFENFQILQERKKNSEDSRKHRVRCFEDINEIEEFSFEAEENIIHEFLYTLQSFFIPSDLRGVNQSPSLQTDKKNNKSFLSSSNNNFERSVIIGTKEKRIHNSRSKHVITGGIKPKRTIFSDEKMIQSINLNKPISPLKFDEMMVYKGIPEVSFKMTNSQVLNEQSIQSENMEFGNQQDLLKTIFQLRQQILALKQTKYNQNATFSQNSSVFFDGSLVQHNFRSRQSQISDREELIPLDSSKQKYSFKLLNEYEAKIKEQQLPNPSMHPIVIKQELQNEDSKMISESNSFKLSMLEKIQVEQDKQNNPNIMNSQVYAYSKTTKLKNFSNDSFKILNSDKKFKKMDSKVIQCNYQPKSQQKDYEIKKQVKQNINASDFKKMLNYSLEIYEKSFKRMFKVDIEIQLVLLNFIRKRRAVDKNIYNDFSQLIEWFSKIKIHAYSKQESVGKLMLECIAKKQTILQKLKMTAEKER